MEVYWYLTSILITVGGVQSEIEEKGCDSSESVVCRDEFENLKEFTQKYQYVSDNNSLNELCRKQLGAVNCVNSFAEKCLHDEDQEVYKTLIKGSDTFIEYFCLEDSQLRTRYLKHSECIREVTRELDDCTRKYEKKQKELDDQESETDALTKGTCCLYFEHISCSANATSAWCGDEAGELVRELWRLLGGTFLNHICVPYQSKIESSCSTVSKATRIDNLIDSLVTRIVTMFLVMHNSIIFYRN